MKFTLKSIIIAAALLFPTALPAQGALEPVATPSGSSLSGTGSSSGPRWDSAEITCATEGATIHYELYEYTTGVVAPEVTEESPVYDPANPQIWINCKPGKTYGIVARAFKDGMAPSDTKYGWHTTIYNETTKLSELAELPNGVANFGYPICYTGEAVVTHFNDYQGFTGRDGYEFNYLYDQDEDYAIALQFYAGDLKPGDKVTNLCIKRSKDNKGLITYQLLRTYESNKNKELKYQPKLIGHTDELPYKVITPDEAKSQFPYRLVKIEGIEDVDYGKSDKYFEMKYNGEWVPSKTLRGNHDDPSLREGHYLERGKVYNITGLVENVKNAYNTFLLFTGAEEAVLEPVATPAGSSLSGTGISNGPRWQDADITCATEGATIHYELYEYYTGVTAPEVTENSPIFDPENPKIWINCEPLKSYGIRVRAFKKGMAPSAVKAGWRVTIYNETDKISELENLDNGAANPNFPICYTGEALVTRFVNYKANSSRSDYEYNYLYIQDADCGLALQYYDGDLTPGDKITDLVIRRDVDSRGKVSYQLLRANSNSKYDATLKYQPTVLGHVDEMPYKVIAPTEAKSQFPYCLVKIENVGLSSYSGNYFTMKHNGKSVASATLRGNHDDPAFRDGHFLEAGNLYTITGLVDVTTNSTNTFLLMMDTEKQMPQVMTPRAASPHGDYSIDGEVTVAGNHPVYLVCEEPDSKIYYTLDGSEPTEESTLYTGPFALPKQPEVTVRYKAYADGCLPAEGTPRTYVRTSMLTSNFEFSNPASLGLEDLADGEVQKVLDGPQTFTAAVDDLGDMTITMTPAEGSNLLLRKDREGQTVLEIPEGTRMHVEFGYAITGLRYRHDYYSNAYKAFMAENSSLNGKVGSYSWDIAASAGTQHSVDFIAGLVGSCDENPALQSLYVYVDPSKSMAATEVSLDLVGKTLTKGEELQLSATVGPEYAVDKNFNWASSDATVATVSQDGLVKALKSGKVVISAYVVNNPDAKAECEITVINPARDITISHMEINICLGETFTLTATVHPEDADDTSVVWTSSDETVATVADGVVSTVKAGQTDITATDVLGHSAVCEITVYENSGITAAIADGSVTFAGRTITVRGLEGATFTIYDLTGKVVGRFVADGDHTVYNAHLQTGIYLLSSSTAIPAMKIHIR